MIQTQMLRDALHTFSRTFTPLRIRNLRIYLGGQAISLLGTWMQSTAQAWVVWQISHSTVDLGVNAMLGMLPFLLLGPWISVWADRLERRRLLIGTQVSSMLLAVILAVLVQTGTVQLWHVHLLALLLGMVNALDMPTQQAFIGELSGRDKVREAIVLNVMIVQVSRMVGPAFAGWVISALGVTLTFWLNALSFVAVIVSLLAVHGNRGLPRANSASALHDFHEGVRFIMSEPRLQDMMLFVALIAVLFISAAQILPAFASDILHGQADTLGWLLGSSGVGALIGTVIVVPIAQRLPRPGLVVGIALILTGFWLVIFALSSNFIMAILSMAGASVTASVVITVPAGVMQLMTPPAMWARVVSVRLMMSFGLVPIASLFVGFTAHYVGTSQAFLLNAVLMIAGASLILVRRPALRQWLASRPVAA